MVRALKSMGVLLCGLLMAAPASADVIYFKQGAPVPKALTDTGWGFSFRHPTSGRVYPAFMGRIHKVGLNASRTSTYIEFEPAKVTRVNVSWSETDPRLRQQPKVQWARSAVRVDVSTLRRIDHEFDGRQDLRFAFSNRDVLLNDLLGKKVGSIKIGEEPFHTYFLAAGGVSSADHLRTLSPSLRASFRGLGNGSGGLKPLPTADLQEGWLVNWLSRGPLTTAARAKLFADAFGSKKQLNPPNFVPDPFGFHPIQWETDIKTFVLSLIRAAAQDYRYSRPGPRGEAATNPRGAFGLGVNADGDTSFFLICLHTLKALCDQVDEVHPRAQAMGFMARDAVLSALEGAALGQYAAIDDPALRASLASKRPELTTGMDVDPSDMALVAMRVIFKSPSWQTARFDTAEGRQLAKDWAGMHVDTRPERPRPGKRVIQALLALARDPNDPREPRANDRLRSRDPRRSVGNVPGYGFTTELKARLVPTVEHLMIGPGRREFLRHTAEVLVESVSQVEEQHDRRGMLLQDQHTVSVREFSQMIVGRSGYGEPFIMKEVVDRLFAIALMPDGERGGPGKTLRDLIRRDAIASLSHLASLGDRSKRNMSSPSDGVDDELTPHALAVGEYETISSMVFERVTTMLERRRQGFGSQSDDQFFGSLGMMANQPLPPRPLEGHAAAFYNAYERRMRELLTEDPHRRERVRELEGLLSKPNPGNSERR